ncbi:MAG: EF-hand domain-containing protein [Pseudonocardiaceae bacterium]
MTTVTQNPNLEQRFNLYDTDDNGRIDRSDFEAEALRVIRAFREDPDLPRGQAVMNSHVSVYNYLARKAGVGDEGMNLADFTGVVNKEINDRGDIGFSQVLRPMIEAMVALCDTDGDGKIQLQEYQQWITATGASNADSEESFRQIDKDDDGALSIEELVDAVKQYHFGQSSNPMLG